MSTIRRLTTILASAALAVPASAEAASPAPAPESISGSGIVAATHYALSVTAGPFGEHPAGTLSLNGFFNFDATLTCVNEVGQDGVAGFRIDTGPQAGLGFLTASQSADGVGPGAILYSGVLPTPPTTCPPPGTPPPTLEDQGGGGDVHGTLVHTGGPDHPLPFQQVSFPTPATPGAISQGPGQALWFAEPGADRIASAPDDESGQITEHDVPAPVAGITAIAADPSAGGAWFTESRDDAAGYISPVGAFTMTPLPAGARPSAISATTDGRAWVTEPGTRQLALVDRSGHVQQTPAGATPTAIAAVPGRDLAWVTEAGAGTIMLAGSGAGQDFPTPTAASRPTEIVSDGADGAWFIESGAGQLAHIDGSGAMTEYPLPSGDSAAQGLASGPGPDGSTGGAWFSEPARGRIGFISAGGDVDEFTLRGATPGALTVAPTLSAPPLSGYTASEAVWWTDAANGRLGLARFPLGGPGALPSPAVPVFGAVSVTAPHAVTVRRSVIALTIRCSGLVSCSGDATLRHQVRGPHAPPVLATHRFRIRAGHRAALRLALNGRGRGLVAAARRAGLHAGLTVRWSSYGHQVVRLITLHPAPQHVRRRG